MEAQALKSPGAPSRLKATSGDSQVSLSWEEPKAAGQLKIDYYIVYQDGVDVKHSVSTSTVITGLTNERTYSFAVAAHNAEGVGDRTSAVKATPKASTTVPGTPTNLQSTAGDAAVSLSWTAPSSNGGATIDYYVIYRDGVDVLHVTGTLATISGLTNGRTYEFTVAAHSSAGTGQRSNPVAVTPTYSSPQAIAPGAPTDLRATPGERAVTLSWTAPAGEANIAYYIVYQNGVDVMHLTGTSATISGLTDGETYAFGVAAYGPGGTGPSSVVQEAIPTSATAVQGARDNTLLMAGMLVTIGVVGAVVLLLMNRTRTRRSN